MSTSDAAEAMIVSRFVDAAPEDVFALLREPTRHQDTEPSDWVRDAIDTAPLTEVGQIFGMNMYLDKADGHYVVHNRVSGIVPDSEIAWLPGEIDDAGRHRPGGWEWRYRLQPEAGGTRVTLIYDWSRTPEPVRAEIGGMPPFGPGFLEKSLAALDAALTAS
ncbi:ATPase [Gordonia sp. VNK1]|jgi:hypothetical protein|uniref:ATPase n=1 Tax=Gordonia oleivorans TaxID=3156618 RepID=UPI0032B382D9